MEIIITKNYEEMSQITADIIVDTITTNRSAVLCLAAGDTPRRAYFLAANKILEKGVDISYCKFVSLDEWVGIPPENEGSCQFFLREMLFKPLNVKKENLRVFDGLSRNLDAECEEMDQFIMTNGGIDLMVVGIGRNGHIGFNEPGVAFDKFSHVVELDSTTTSVGQKYFRESTALTKGITLGLKHLTQAKRALLIANGNNKAQVIHEALDGEITPEMPASIIRQHVNASVIVDEAAASLVQTRPR